MYKGNNEERSTLLLKKSLPHVRSVAPSDHRHPYSSPPAAHLQVWTNTFDMIRRLRSPLRVCLVVCLSLCGIIEGWHSLTAPFFLFFLDRKNQLRRRQSWTLAPGAPPQSTPSDLVQLVASSPWLILPPHPLPSASLAPASWAGGEGGRGDLLCPINLSHFQYLLCATTQKPEYSFIITTRASNVISNPFLPFHISNRQRASRTVSALDPSKRRPHGAEPHEGWAQAHGVEPHSRRMPTSSGRGRNSSSHRRGGMRSHRGHLRDGLNPRGCPGVRRGCGAGPRRGEGLRGRLHRRCGYLPGEGHFIFSFF